MGNNEVLIRDMPQDWQNRISRWTEQLLNERELSFTTKFQDINIGFSMSLNDSNLNSRELVLRHLIAYLRLALQTIEDHNSFKQKFGLSDSNMWQLIEEDKSKEMPISFRIFLSKD